MDFYRDVFRWHERFLPQVLHAQLLLLEERETLMFESPEALQLEAVLAQQISLQTLVETRGWMGPLPDLLYLLEDLAARQLVQRCQDVSRSYVTPDLTAAIRHSQVTPQVAVMNLSAGVSDAALAAFARELATGAEVPLIGAPVTVVCCDDLADPRLAAVERSHRAPARTWMLWKATGIQAALGPVFKPSLPGNACWHCFAQRVLWNRPVAAWWLARRAELPPVPIAAEPASIAARLGRAPALARILLLESAEPLLEQQAFTQRVLTWTGEHAPAAHVVTRRPQCPACGDPQYMSRQQQQPVRTARCIELPHAGDSRSVPAEVSLQRLLPQVSPLCGVVAQLEPVIAGSGVYRSGFFKQARSEEALPSVLTQVCLGKGLSTARAQMSALGEALERYAAQYQGDEACIEAASATLDAPCISPQLLLEHAQPATRWAPAWSLTHDARCYLPFEFCYANTPWQETHAAAWTSNGCAAGNTLEEAILQGLLELVERDAAAIWWYNQIQRPAFDWATLPQHCRDYVAATLPPQWDAWVLDLTHDLGIAVAVAIAQHRVQRTWAVGFGCSLDTGHACERALTELNQLIAVDRRVAVPGADAGQTPTFLLPGVKRRAVLPSQCTATDVRREIERCVGNLTRCGLECVVLDYSRPDLPLRTVKVVVPGLCHIWPGRFSARLQQVPVALQWLTSAIAPADLNPQALYL